MLVDFGDANVVVVVVVVVAGATTIVAADDNAAVARARRARRQFKVRTRSFQLPSREHETQGEFVVGSNVGGTASAAD